MSTIAFLVMDDRREWQNALHGAFFACCVLSALWIVFAFLGKRKGKPLELSYGFWCLAGPGWLGLVGFLIAIFENRVASIIILLLAVVLPVLLAVKKFRPNKRPDGTSAKAPPSKPSQGAAVPHP